MSDDDWDAFSAEAAQHGRPRQQCSVDLLLKSLGDTGRAAVEAALARRELTSPAIIAALKQRGIAAPSPFSLNRHRRADCSCKEEAA